MAWPPPESSRPCFAAREIELAEIDARHGAARAARDGAQSLAPADDDGGAVEFLLQAAGDDADDARVPAFGAGDENAGVGLLRQPRLDLRDRLLLDVGLDLLALLRSGS